METVRVANQLPVVLNLGCGNKHIPGALNVDVSSQVGADLVHDLQERPWPLPDKHFKEVHLYDVLEHVTDIVETLDEVHRVCSEGATVHITVPHFSSVNSYSDPTHRHLFSTTTLSYLDPAHPLSFYGRGRFRVKSQLVFEPTLLGRLVGRVANRATARFEKRWAFLFPAWFVYFQLEALPR
jgi:hypothetical protein